ncbi:MAG: hypothetical protein AB8B78_03570 [Polaribacter sp.]
MKIFTFLILFSITFSMNSQEKLPYYEIPEMEENYTAQTTVARMIDGLGFRYYWSTEGLKTKDLAYKPAAKGRSSLETVHHIYDLSSTMLRLTKTDFKQAKDKKEMTFLEMRKQTLLNFEALRNKILSTKNLSELSIKKNEKVSIPFFYMINGSIADAIWHTGQIASFRRSSGNPINPKVNHFSGTVRE